MARCEIDGMQILMINCYMRLWKNTCVQFSDHVNHRTISLFYCLLSCYRALFRIDIFIDNKNRVEERLWKRSTERSVLDYDEQSTII